MICKYGCGDEARYQIGNGNWCCSEYTSQCPEVRRKQSKSMKGKNTGPRSEEHKEKIRNSMIGKNTGPRSEEIKRKISKSRIGVPLSKVHVKNLIKSRTYSIEKWQKKYPIFAKVEELREHPETGEIQVHCKNHKCKNSKENGGWFTPTRSKFYSRIAAIETPKDFGENNFYCSEECKEECVLYGLKYDPLTNLELQYTQAEYKVFRHEVLKRQKYELGGYNECEICHNRNLKELEVHHEIPVKKNWIFSLDPDNGIILCRDEKKNCHIKYGHKTGTSCSTSNLANAICI